MLRTAFGLLSPQGPKARLCTLIFHRVLPEPDELFPGEVDARQFDEICGWVRRWFNVLPLDEAVQRLVAGTLPSRALGITFDDGYEDNESVALPILRKHGLTATFFVATGFIDGGRMWNDTIIESVRLTRLPSLDLSDSPIGDLGYHELRAPAQRRGAIDAIVAKTKYLQPDERLRVTRFLAERAQVDAPDDLMMSSGQVRALRRAGMLVGGHTVTHPILAKLDPAEALREVAEGKRHLEELIGEPVGLFAYPNGRPGEDYSPANVEQVRGCGFMAAMSTVWGTSVRGDDLFQLRRFTPWDRTPLRFGLRMAGNLRAAKGRWPLAAASGPSSP